MPVVTAIVAAVVTAASVVGAVAVAVVATVGTVVAAVVGTIATVVGSVTSLLGAALGGAIETVGGIIEVISSGVQGAVGAIKSSIAEPIGNIISGLKTAVLDVGAAITEPLMPILNPIKDSLVSMKDFMVEVKTWLELELAPVSELIEVVNTLSAIQFVKQLIEGTGDITSVLGDVEKESGLATVQAIATLFKGINDIGIATMKYTRDQTIAVAKSIDDFDERIREDNKTAYALLTGAVDEQITQVTNAMSLRFNPIESDVIMITRRTEDIPYFQDMLIKALA